MADGRYASCQCRTPHAGQGETSDLAQMRRIMEETQVQGRTMRAVQAGHRVRRCAVRRSLFGLHLAVATWAKEASARCRASMSAAAPCHSGPRMSDTTSSGPRCKLNLRSPVAPTNFLTRALPEVIAPTQDRNNGEGHGQNGPPTCGRPVLSHKEWEPTSRVWALAARVVAGEDPCHVVPLGWA